MDKQTADKLITEYFKKIYAFSIKKAFSYDEAEDLCAEIVKEVYISLLKADGIINTEGYVWRICYYTYSKYVAFKKKQEGISIDGLQIPFYENYFSEELEDKIKELRREVAFLTKKRRFIVYSFYYKNRPISTIAKEMGIPEGTVKWHLNKARTELKEGFGLERKIGKLGLSPITAKGFGHSGNPGKNNATEVFLGDKLNLNIVYSVYYTPKNKKEIAEELGLTPVFIEDKIDYLEENGFLVKTTDDRYTTFVKFDAEKFSLELHENKLKTQINIAQFLAKDYVPLVRKAMEDVKDVYIPGGNRQLLEAAAIFYGVVNKCGIPIKKDLSKYMIKTTGGGEYIAFVHLNSEQEDLDYKSTLELPSYYACGDMIRSSQKYPAVFSWSMDTRYSSRTGAWENNLTVDYEYLYEFLNGTLADNAANAEKYARLKERGFLTEENKVNIMMVNGSETEFFAKIPTLSDEHKERFADLALEYAVNEAKYYPPQMQDLIITWGVRGLISSTVALMLMDILYKNGTFKPLTEKEKVTSNLIMFSDKLPDGKLCF